MRKASTFFPSKLENSTETVSAIVILFSSSWLESVSFAPPPAGLSQVQLRQVVSTMKGIRHRTRFRKRKPPYSTPLPD
ncbi:MAG: hypothetical protein ACRD21_23750 [Vicinamibacteria bacterium]